MLWSSSALGCWFPTVTFVEAIDASRGIDQLLFAGEERVAGRTYFDVQIALASRASFEALATRAGNCYLVIVWVNSWFHLLPHRRRKAAFTNGI